MITYTEIKFLSLISQFFFSFETFASISGGSTLQRGTKPVMGIKSKMESKRYDCSLNQSKSTLSCDFFPLKFPYKHNAYWKIMHIANSWYSKHNKWGSPYSFLAVPDVYNFVFTDLNECYSSPCENGGSCVGDYKNYTCTCTKDWIGRNCEIAHSKLFFPDCLNRLFYYIIHHFINKTAVEK